MKLRKATLKDSDWILKLSNSTRVYSINNKSISKKEHNHWFKENYKDIKVIGNNLGTIRIQNKELISIAIKKEFRNKHIGTNILKNIKHGSCIILLGNNISIAAFVNAGFKVRGFYLEK